MNGLIYAACGLLGLALVFALVLVRQTLLGGTLPGCGAGSACGEVAKGRWGRIASVPVSILGAVAYGGLIGLTLGRLWTGVAGLSIMVLILAAWFMGLQLLAIRRICPYCTAAHLCAAAGAAMLLWLGPHPWPHQAMIAGAALAAVFILAQVSFPPKLFEVVQGPSQEIAVAPPPAEPVADPTPQPPPTRRIYVMNNQISLSQHLWPVLGPREAQHVVVDLLDYTCHDCRQMHGLLTQAVEHYAGRLAVIPMPVPMDPSCNPTVRGVNPLHRYACPIARLALGVWRASPQAFIEFDHWLFVPYQPRSPQEAKLEAERLVGPAGLAQAMEDPWLEKRMKEAITIYQAVGAGRIPNLLMPHAMVRGVVPNLAELIKTLDQQFATPVAQPR